MRRNVKIILCVLFILAVAFFVAKGCMEIRKPVTKPVPVKQVRMAIVLDDWGNSFALVKKAIAIQRPLTLAVLPHLIRSSEVASEAKKYALGVMLHMPMQPQSRTQPLEPHTILTTMPDAQIIQYLSQALGDVPEAEGVNNHQGSAATTDARVMNTVLKYLKSRGLFFMDSQVIPTSLAWKTAKKLGVPCAKRDVFIDNKASVEAVKEKLRQAQKLALERGSVVVIGHAKKATLEAIGQMVPELERNGIQLVLVKELLE